MKSPPLTAAAAAYQGALTPRNRATMASRGRQRSQARQWPVSSRKTTTTRPGSSRPTGPLASTAMPANSAIATRPRGARQGSARWRWASRKPNSARLMALERNMSVVEVRPQPIQPGVVAITPAATTPLRSLGRPASPAGDQASIRPKAATTTALAARATGSRAAHSLTPNSRKLSPTIQ